MTRTEPTNYPTDSTDEQWQILCRLLPRPSGRSAPQRNRRRAIVNAIFYVLRSGCAWWRLPHDFPEWKTFYGVFPQRRNNETWQEIHDTIGTRSESKTDARLLTASRSWTVIRSKRPNSGASTVTTQGRKLTAASGTLSCALSVDLGRDGS
jgi:transposase